MKKKTMSRVLSIAMALLLAMTALVAFSGCVKQEEKINSSWTSADVDAETYFARILPQSSEAREKFVAASRGYNMSAPGFDDNHLPAPDPSGVSLEGAKAALLLVKPADDPSILKFDEFYNALTAEQVTGIVTRMAEVVDLTVDNGPIDTLLVLIGKFVQLLTKMTGGLYVLGLFFFAIVVELLMLPFGIRQQKNSRKQARLRPKEMAIRNKYKGRNDQVTMQKMNQEIQKLYQDEGYNPMGGCLPLLIQMPIVIALYNIVIDPLRYVLGLAESLSSALSTYCTAARAAGGLGLELGTGKGTIELLSQLGGGQLEGLRNFAFFANREECFNALNNLPELNFNLFGLNMGIIPGFRQPFVLLLIPVLTFAFYFASMKLTRKFTYQPVTTDPQMGCSNNMMDITMPLMSVYITFIVPAAVGIYWIFKCIISTVKQFVIHKAMPLPTFTEEDYKAAERELKGKTKHEKKPAGERTSPSGKKVRSLHHIDDDDEPLPPSVPEKKEDPAKSEQPAGQEEKKNDMRAPMKDDRKDDEKK
ncbi:MAG: YidC/Oxa1 family membrane protein insertase [Ruminococcaceae bacterium]|nr:YidC/Oxa1 family membrane protein insertase [Oscillospiraceae bacterium]